MFLRLPFLTLLFMVSINFLPTRALATLTKNDARSVTVEEVASLTLKNNYDIRVANYDIDINELSVDYAKATYDGVISFSSGYTLDKSEQLIGQVFGTDNRSLTWDFGFTKQFSFGTGLSLSFNNVRQTTDSTFVATNPSYDSSFEIGLSQPLLKNFGGMTNRLNVDIARVTTEVLDLSAQERIAGKLFTALTLYWEMYRAWANLDITRRSRQKAGQLVKISRGKLKRGLLEKGDVYAFEALNSSRQSDVIAAEKTFKDVTDMLKFELAMEKDSPIIPGEEPSVKEVSLDPDENLSEAFKARRDYLGLKKQIDAKNLEARLYKNSRYPRLDLVTSLNANGLSDTYGGAVKDVPRYKHPTWFIGIEMDLNVDNRTARSNFKKAKLEKARTLVELKKVESKIVEDIKIALRAIQASRKEVEKAAQTKKFQSLKLQEEEKKFSQGRSRSETIVNYEEDILQAELMEMQALISYEKNFINLLYAKNVLLARFLM